MRSSRTMFAAAAALLIPAVGCTRTDAPSPRATAASPAAAGPALGSAAAAASSASAPATAAPLETRPPNAPEQRPSFPGQTRAPGIRDSAPHAVEVVAKGLAHPWAVEPLPSGGFLVTERPGRMRVVTATGEIGPPLEGVPAVAARDQGGLLDVELSPAFATDRTIYWTYAEPREGGSGTSVARGLLSADGTALQDVRVILKTKPTYDNGMHFGSRVLVGPDGMLYVTMGERSDRATRPQAQDPGSHLGKLLRIATDGSIPPDNPFVGTAGTLPEIWSIGQRNVQAAAFDPSGRLFTVDHGARGGDELNLIVKGANYGWPIQTFGVEYSGDPIATGRTEREGIRSPVYYWDPVIAPSGAQFYTASAFPQWKGSLFVGGLASQRLVRLVIDGERVTGEEHLLTDRNQRIRDVRQGPDGFLYVVTDEPRGELWRIRPAS